MGNTMGSRQYWCDWYDVKGRILEGFRDEQNRTLLVDVAGGKGHDLQAFAEKFEQHGDAAAKDLVLQEIQRVIDNLDINTLDKRIDVIARFLHSTANQG